MQAGDVSALMNMGAKQSKLKKEIEALKADAVATANKHKEDVEALRGEKRMLEFKLQALQEMAAKAQIEAETATQLAVVNEEKMKALKWELVRRLTAPSNISLPVSSSHSTLTSASSIPRIPVTWKLKDGITLHRSNTSATVNRALRKQDQFFSTSSEKVLSRDSHQFTQEKMRIPKPTPTSVTGDLDLSSRIPSNQLEASDAKNPANAESIPNKQVNNDFDKFAPVKRRSSTKDVLNPTADAQAKSVHRVESFSKGGKSTSSDCESERGRESSSKDEAEPSRIVARRDFLGLTKGSGSTIATADHVLALSDDEED